MEIVEFEEVKDSDLTELCLACFDHVHSKARLKKMIRSDDRLPDWGGELYAVQGDKALGVVGLLYPEIRKEENFIKVGGIRNVCTRPSASKQGIAKKLMKRAHQNLRKKVDYSFLMTSASNVAYNLYRNLGYEDVYIPQIAYKKKETVESDVEFRKEKDPDYVRSVYMNSVRGLTGLVKRDKRFWQMAKSRGWPDNEKIKIAYKNGSRIGYAMVDQSREKLSVKEMGAEEGFLVDLMFGLENYCEKDHIVLSYVNPNYKNAVERHGYSWTDDLWYRVMVKDLREGSNSTADFTEEDNFHAGIYECY